MWPMLLGMAPLLRTSVVNNEDVGSFETAQGPQRWTLTATAVQLAGKPVLDFGQSGHVLRQPGAPVAVLFGPRTGSSGEASVLAWRGRRRRAASASRRGCLHWQCRAHACRWQSPAADHQRDARPQ
jgi:hypothetical protein